MEPAPSYEVGREQVYSENKRTYEEILLNNGAFGSTKPEIPEGMSNAVDSAKGAMESGWSNITKFGGAVKNKVDDSAITQMAKDAGTSVKRGAREVGITHAAAVAKRGITDAAQQTAASGKQFYKSA